MATYLGTMDKLSWHIKLIITNIFEHLEGCVASPLNFTTQQAKAQKGAHMYMYDSQDIGLIREE